MHVAEILLRLGETLIGGFLKPIERRLVVFGDAIGAGGVEDAH